jgi:hypothetical protein
MAAFGFCLSRMMNGPDEIALAIEPAIRKGTPVSWVQNLSDVEALRAWFFRVDLMSAIAAAFAVAGWILVSTRTAWPRWFAVAVGTLMLADMLWFASGRMAQCDPARYYPPLAPLEQIASAAAGGRVIGYGCFPAQLPEMFHLNDIRGYDSIDPGRMVNLLELAAQPGSRRLPYAAVEWLKPKAAISPDGKLHFPPVLDLLGVRFLICDNAAPTAKPVAAVPGCLVFENTFALPRVFIPRRVETVPDSGPRLARLGAADFNPREVAYVETPLTFAAPSEGTAGIEGESPSRVRISVQMKTPGLVLLADQWDPGWKAAFNGQPVPILRVDHALRGVALPAGEGVLEFRYASRTVLVGFVLAGLAAFVIVGGLAMGMRPG